MVLGERPSPSPAARPRPRGDEQVWGMSGAAQWRGNPSSTAGPVRPGYPRRTPGPCGPFRPRSQWYSRVDSGPARRLGRSRGADPDSPSRHGRDAAGRASSAPAHAARWAQAGRAAGRGAGRGGPAEDGRGPEAQHPGLGVWALAGHPRRPGPQRLPCLAEMSIPSRPGPSRPGQQRLPDGAGGGGPFGRRADCDTPQCDYLCEIYVRAAGP